MSSYQITLFIGTLITILFIVVSVVKTKMNIRYAIIWMLWGIIMLILSLYPGIIDKLSVVLGIAVTVNTVFLIFIFLLYAISFYLFGKVSELSNEIKNLTYQVSVLKKNIEDKND